MISAITQLFAGWRSRARPDQAATLQFLRMFADAHGGYLQDGGTLDRKWGAESDEAMRRGWLEVSRWDDSLRMTRKGYAAIERTPPPGA